MSEISGKTVLITGGAAGIGKIMGEICLRKKAKCLVIWDIDPQALQTTVQEFKAQGFTVIGNQVDVSNLEAIQKNMAQVPGPIDILINNAGIVVGKTFWEHSHQDIDRTLQINTSALMHLAKEVLPQMIHQKNGHIVNISSAAGLVANSKMSVYCGSKWAVIGWSESLRIELEQMNSGVHVTTVTPFYINTGMFEGVRSPFIPILEPRAAAELIVQGIEKNKIFVRMPKIIYLLPLVKGLLPTRVFDFVVGKMMGIYKSMNHFVGHSK